MLKSIIVILLLIFSSLLSAQDTSTSKWTSKGVIGMQMNQIYFQDWAQGGDKNFTNNIFLRYNTSYSGSSFTWTNDVDLGYGINWTEENGWRKNQDKIELNSKYNHNTFKKTLKWAIQLNFKSQFVEGFNFPNDSVRVSTFMAPAWLNLTAGIDWNPNEHFSVLYSPVSGRIIFVLDERLSDLGTFGVDPGQRVRPELGSNLVIKSNGDIFTNVNADSKLELFMNYTPLDPNEITNIDVNWETNVVMKVNSWLSVNLFVHLIYDHDIIQRLQIRQLSGLGISYKL